MQEEHYERLPGGHLGFLSRDSLWLGSDHILLVKDLGYLERYQRYYFRDIQGLTLEPTPRYVRIAFCSVNENDLPELVRRLERGVRSLAAD